MAKNPKIGELVVLSVHALDGKGQGLSKMGEYKVRVRGAVPGDKVVARIRKVQHRRQQIDAFKETLHVEGMDRIPPRCSHFGTCGGCLWQDLPYEGQIRLKQKIVENSLQEVGIYVPLELPLPAETAFFYRNKMEFSFGNSSEGVAELGLHEFGRFDRIFDLQACYLQSDQSNQIVDRIRRFIKDRCYSVYHSKQHKGLLRFLTVREAKRTGEVMIILTTTAEDFPDANLLGMQLIKEFPKVRSVVHSINRRKAQIAIGDEEIVLGGSPNIQEKLGNFTFEISPSSFFQPNTLQAERLYHRVIEMAGPLSKDRVLDVYCGTGGISLFLSEFVREVVGVEIAESAVKDAVRNGVKNGVDNCRFISGPAEEILQELKAQGERFDLAVTDPPRPGMHVKALEALARLGPKRIIYVSCNPQALGEDLKRLEKAGYQIDCVQLVDMLPHTPHCEVLARLFYQG